MCLNGAMKMTSNVFTQQVSPFYVSLLSWELIDRNATDVIEYEYVTWNDLVMCSYQIQI